MSSPTTNSNISQIIDPLIDGAAYDLEIAKGYVNRASYLLKGAANLDIAMAKEQAVKKVEEIFADIKRNPQKAVSIFCDGLSIDGAAKESLQKVKAALEEAKSDVNKAEEFAKTVAEAHVMPDDFLRLATTMIGVMAKSGAFGTNIENIVNVISLFENIIEKDGRTAAGDLSALMSGLASLNLQGNPMLAAIVQQALAETFGESVKLFGDFSAEEIAEEVEPEKSFTEEVFAIGSIIASIAIPAPFGMIAAEVIEEVGHYVEEHGGLEGFAKEISDAILPEEIDARDVRLESLASEVAKPLQPLEYYVGKSEVGIAAQMLVDEKENEMTVTASGLASNHDLMDRITAVSAMSEVKADAPEIVIVEDKDENVLSGEEIKKDASSMKGQVSSKELPSSSPSPLEARGVGKENLNSQSASR